MKKLKEDLHLWIAQEMIKSVREGTFIFLHMVQKTKQLFCFRYSDICIHHLLYSTTCFSENSVLVPLDETLKCLLCNHRDIKTV